MDVEAHTISTPQPREPRGGYASLSKFIASDHSLFIFRRFDSLAVRNLLYMQDELCEIEQQINELDESDMVSKCDEDLYSLHSRRFDENQRRVALMQKFAQVLKRYGRLVVQFPELLYYGVSRDYHQLSIFFQRLLPFEYLNFMYSEKSLLRRSSLLALQKPKKADITSLKNWMKAKNPTIPEESHFLDLPTDLVPLLFQGDQTNFLESFLEKQCYRLFSTAKHRAKPHAVSDPKYIHYYSLTTIRRVIRLVVTLTAVLVTTAPTFALYYENRPVVRLALIVVFALALAVILAFTTNCKNQEMFAIIAAYAAVMIVFVGNNPSI